MGYCASSPTGKSNLVRERAGRVATGGPFTFQQSVGVDPATNLTNEMDARVKPAHDRNAL
jgi:hypothetical protein